MAGPGPFDPGRRGVRALAVVAVGLPGDPALLTADWQRAGETPNQRRPIADSVVFGSFAAKA